MAYRESCEVPQTDLPRTFRSAHEMGRSIVSNMANPAVGAVLDPAVLLPTMSQANWNSLRAKAACTLFFKNLRKFPRESHAASYNGYTIANETVHAPVFCLQEKLHRQPLWFRPQQETVMLDKRHKILVVDDERAIVSLRATILESQGYEAATAYSGEEAVQVACSFQPDCIVSDVTMGAMNGIDAAIEILRGLPQCKVLFVSGNATCRDLLGEAIAKGFKFEILAKPVPTLELLDRISQIFSD